MIDETRKRIYTDFSTLARFADCHEQQRLGGVLGYRPIVTDEKLGFGHAVHAGWAAHYDALAGGYRSADGTWIADDRITPLDAARIAFLRDLGVTNTELPITSETGVARSAERGLALLEAYFWKYRNELYENVLDAEGAPLVEVGFQYYLTTFEGYEVFYTGKIDRIMRSMKTQRLVNFEGKTTREALSRFILRRRPNHQITGYYRGGNDVIKALNSNLPEIKETIWDAMFLSERGADMARAARSSEERFWMYGIDIDKDFMRAPTSRSQTDFSEFMFDTESLALEYCKWLTSNATRWPRSAPRACHSYGGCPFIERCSINLDPDQELIFLNGRFKIERWEPWREIVAKLDRSSSTSVDSSVASSDTAGPDSSR